MKALLIIMGIIIMGSGYAVLWAGFKYNISKDFAHQVRDCFPSSCFNTNSFISGGDTLTDKYDNSKFYPCKDIDEDIDKLNEVLNKAK